LPHSVRELRMATFESASQFFVCSPLSGGGLTLNQRFTLLDAGAGKQGAFDESPKRARRW